MKTCHYKFWRIEQNNFKNLPRILKNFLKKVGENLKQGLKCIIAFGAMDAPVRLESTYTMYLNYPHVLSLVHAHFSCPKKCATLLRRCMHAVHKSGFLRLQLSVNRWNRQETWQQMKKSQHSVVDSIGRVTSRFPSSVTRFLSSVCYQILSFHFVVVVVVVIIVNAYTLLSDACQVPARQKISWPIRCTFRRQRKDLSRSKHLRRRTASIAVAKIRVTCAYTRYKRWSEPVTTTGVSLPDLGTGAGRRDRGIVCCLHAVFHVRGCVCNHSKELANIL